MQNMFEKYEQKFMYECNGRYLVYDVENVLQWNFNKCSTIQKQTKVSPMHWKDEWKFDIFDICFLYKELELIIYLGK